MFYPDRDGRSSSHVLILQVKLIRIQQMISARDERVEIICEIARSILCVP